MIDSFQELYEQVDLCEDRQISMRVGLYPGAFKPPHIGHYEAAKIALSQNDVVFVLVSGICRGSGCDAVTPTQSARIWHLYKQDIGDSNLKIVPVSTWKDPDTGSTSTVITATYDIVHLLNTGGQYEAVGKFLDSHPVAKNVYKHVRGNNSFHVTVYAGEEDFSGRYSGLPTKGDTGGNKRYIDQDVFKISQGKTPRIASASHIRPFVAGYRQNKLRSSIDVREKILQGSINHDDFASVRKNLPGDERLKDRVIDILLDE
jgi:hypothetical protein